MKLKKNEIKNFKYQKISTLILSLFMLTCFIFSCDNSNKNKQKNAESSPYKIFFKQLKLKNLTDTILVQNRTKIFGCGTASVMYEEELNKKGLNKFYNEYGTILDDLELIKLFEKNNNIKILWINRGNEGELFELKDSTLHKNKKFEQRLIAQKTFVEFDDEPISLDRVKLTVLINPRNSDKVIIKSFDLSKKGKIWTLDKQNQQEVKKDL